MRTQRGFGFPPATPPPPYGFGYLPAAADRPQEFRQRPVHCLAMQVTNDNAPEVASWLRSLGATDVDVLRQARTVSVAWRGPQAMRKATRGQWVVRMFGSFRAVGDAEFRRQFEPVSGQTANMEGRHG